MWRGRDTKPIADTPLSPWFPEAKRNIGYMLAMVGTQEENEVLELAFKMKAAGSVQLSRQRMSHELFLAGNHTRGGHGSARLHTRCLTLSFVVQEQAHLTHVLSESLFKFSTMKFILILEYLLMS